MGLDSMSGCVLERVWMSRTCGRRRRNGKVMVLFLGNVDFEVVDDVGIGFEKKEIVGLGFHELRVEMLLMIGGQIKECELHWLGEVGLAMVVKDE